MDEGGARGGEAGRGGAAPLPSGVVRLLRRVAPGRWPAAGLAPLAHRLFPPGSPRLDVEDAVARAARDARVSFAVQQSAALEVARALGSAGVAHAFLKGLDLNLRCYPEPGLRPMVDVDVLVDTADLERARQQLAELGYVRLALPLDPPADTALAWRYCRGADGVLVDLHVHVDWPETLGVSTRDLLERRTRAGEVDVLDPLDLVVHLAVHLARDIREEAVHALVDAVLALEALRPSWPELVDRARAWRARPAMRVLLGRLARLGGGDVPSDVLRALEVAILPRLVARWAARFVRPSAVLRGEAIERLVRLFLVERWRDRLRLARRYLALRLRRPA